MCQKDSKNNRKIVAIDFFCGCGGVTHGMKKAKVKVIAGFDNDSEVAYAYENNNKGSKFFHIDINNKDLNVRTIENVLENEHRDLLIFAACAPCQPFSLHNRNHEGDERKSLMLNFINIAFSLKAEFQPDVIFAENVGAMEKRGQEVLQKAIKQLQENNYAILHPKVLNAADHGVPQNRKRLIFIAIKENKVKNRKIFTWDHFTNSKRYRTERLTVGQFIKGLPRINAGQKQAEYDPLHISPALSEINLKRIAQIDVPGGGREKWDEELNLKCYKNHPGHKDVYGRMSWDKPAPTLTCRCVSISNGRYGHPEQNRAISLKEAAILQTMGDYRFKEPINMSKVAKQIGNAVPPELVRKIAKFIKEITL